MADHRAAARRLRRHAPAQRRPHAALGRSLAARSRPGASMIAFGCAITGGEAYRRYAEPGVERRRRAGLRGLRLRGGRADRADLQPDPRRRRRARRPRGARARPLRTPRSPIPRFCAKVRAALRDPDVARRRLRRGRRACAASPGGRGGGRGRPVTHALRGARRRASSRRTRGPSERPPGRGRGRRRPAARALAVGGAQPPLRRGADPQLRLRPRLLPPGRAQRAKRWWSPTCALVHHRSLELVERPRRVDRGAHPGRGEVGRVR